jgi:sarcosine oxidase subunit alpha
VLRVAPDRFVATVSSGHAGHMLSHFEHYRETEWRGRALTLTDVTEAWSVIVAAGPASRGTLQQVLGGEWPEALARLAHMEFCDGHWRGGALRLLRASFSGELAYELHCRPGIALEAWEALVQAGLAPYGLDALDILRVEKGYLTTSEISGQTTPMDLGMHAMLRAGGDCVGRDMLDREAFHEDSRPRLVGLRAADGRAMIPAGAQLTVGPDDAIPCGYVTSSAFSPALGQWVALALLARSQPAEGAELHARDPLRGRSLRVRSCNPVHYDAANGRMKP